MAWKDGNHWHWLSVSAEHVDGSNEFGYRHNTRGRRRWQWDTILCNTLGHCWRDSLATNQVPFKELLISFLDAAFLWTGVDNPQVKRESYAVKKSKKIVISLDERIPREIPPLPRFRWSRPDYGVSLSMFGDSLVVCGWLNGHRRVAPSFSECVGNILRWLHSGWRLRRWQPRRFHDPFITHIYREYNKVAGGLATIGLFSFSASVFSDFSPRHFQHLRVYFDGGFRHGLAGGGVHLQVAQHVDDEEEEEEEDLVLSDVWRAALKIPFPSSSLCADFYAAVEALTAAYSFIEFGHINLHESRVHIPNGHKFFVPYNGALPTKPGVPQIRNLLLEN